MVKPKKLSIRVGISVIVAGSLATHSVASDRTQCHDMPNNQALLNEAKQFLQTAPDRDLSGSSRKRYGFDELNDSSYYEFLDILFNDYEPKIDETTVTDNLESLRKAITTAQTLEQVVKAGLAYEVYSRVLSSPKFSELNESEQADILEGAARTKIELGLKSDNEDSLTFRTRVIKTELFGTLYATPIMFRRFILRNLTKTLLSPEDIVMVKAFCLKASAIREKQKSNENLATDLIILGALCERSKETNKACTYLLRAIKIGTKPRVSAKGETTQEPSRQEDVSSSLTNLVEISTDISDETSSLITSTLIDAYMDRHESKEAISLFRNKCLGQKSAAICITQDSLSSIVDVLPVSDLPALITYILQVFHAENQNAFTEASFSAIMQKLKNRGWDTECDVICNLLSSQANTVTLFTLARWYADSKNDAALVPTLKEILFKIRNDSDTQAIIALTQIQKLIANVSTIQPELAAVKSETSRITAYHEDQIRRKQCLNMAKDLNETAFKLEMKAQPEMASKLYKHALEIKQLNLKPDDPETAAQLVDLGRSEAAQQHFAEAELHFEKALSMMRTNKHTDPSDTISALESFGMMLNDWKHQAKATKVYAEATALHNKIKASPWRHIDNTSN